MKKYRVVAQSLLMLSAWVLVTPELQAVELDTLIKAGVEKTTDAQASQRRIDDTVRQTDTLLGQFQLVNKQIQGLEIYNAQLSRQIDSQRRTMAEMAQSIETAALIERQITPLSLSMLDGLEQFIRLDLPFKIDERQSSIDQVRKNMDSPNFSAAEKFRQVLELYDIESEYSATIEHFDGVLAVDDQDRQGVFLRIGRLALLFQSGDQAVTQVWNKTSGQWQSVSANEYRRSVADAIGMAKKQAPLDLIKLPVPAPVSVPPPATSMTGNGDKGGAAS